MPRTFVHYLVESSWPWQRYRTSVFSPQSIRISPISSRKNCDSKSTFNIHRPSQSTMQITSALLGLAIVATTMAIPAFPLEERSIGSSCSTPVRLPVSTRLHGYLTLRHRTAPAPAN